MTNSITIFCFDSSSNTNNRHFKSHFNILHSFLYIKKKKVQYFCLCNIVFILNICKPFLLTILVLNFERSFYHLQVCVKPTGCGSVDLIRLHHLSWVYTVCSDLSVWLHTVNKVFTKFYNWTHSITFVMQNKLTLLLLTTTCPVLANSVDSDQLASEEANWSGYAPFVIEYVNFYQKRRSSNLVSWKLEVGVAS